jgi:L-asparaginase
MKRLTFIPALLAALIVSLAASSSAYAKPSIRILATGGTIAGAQSGSQSYGYKSGSFKVEDLIGAVPNLKEVANLSGEQVANIGSQDMNDAIWLKLVQRVNQVLSAPDVDGVVITHGTDTMEETAFFLELTVKSEKPVVLVGSMRPATAISADGPGNLFNAVSVAASSSARGRGVLVVLNDEVHSARNVVKTDTTNVDTFKSMNRGPVGLVHTGQIAWFERMDRPHTVQTEFDVNGRSSLPRVDIIYAHANMSPDLIDAAVKDGAKGLVIAGVGDGNMTGPALAAVTHAAKQGVAVVRSTRVAEGMVLRNNEVNDDQAGFAASGEFTAPKARVLLQLALTKTSNIKQIQQAFDRY